MGTYIVTFTTHQTYKAESAEMAVKLAQHDPETPDVAGQFHAQEITYSDLLNDMAELNTKRVIEESDYKEFEELNLERSVATVAQ